MASPSIEEVASRLPALVRQVLVEAGARRIEAHAGEEGFLDAPTWSG